MVLGLALVAGCASGIPTRLETQVRKFRERVGDAAFRRGLERSVRGIDSATAVQSLADVWLTDLR